MSSVANIILFVVFSLILIHAYIQTLLGRPIFFRNNVMEGYNGLNYNPDDLKAQLMSYVYGNNNNDPNFPPMDPATLRRTRNFGVYENGALGNAHSANLYNQETDLSKFFTAVPGPAEHGNMSIEDYTKMLDKARTQDRLSGINRPKHLTYGLQDTTGPSHYEVAADGSLMYRNDQWRYANENVMNGGAINGHNLNGLTGVDPNFYGGPTNDYAVYV